MNSKVIPGEQQSAEKWRVPAVDAKKEGTQNLLTARKLEELQKQAQEEGFQRGHKEGLAKGLQDVQKQAARLKSICDLLQAPLRMLDEQVVTEFVSLAMVLARQIIRRELKADPTHIVGIVREVVGQLPISARTVRVHLHPDDAGIFRESIALDKNSVWQIVDDPSLNHGDCKVMTESSQIDASVERRLTAAVATLLGGDRSGEAAATK